MTFVSDTRQPDANREVALLEHLADIAGRRQVLTSISLPRSVRIGRRARRARFSRRAAMAAVRRGQGRRAAAAARFRRAQRLQQRAAPAPDVVEGGELCTSWQRQRPGRLRCPPSPPFPLALEPAQLSSWLDGIAPNTTTRSAAQPRAAELGRVPPSRAARAPASSSGSSASRGSSGAGRRLLAPARRATFLMVR